MILRDALQKMDDCDERGDKITFGITYVTYDSGRKKGGEIITLNNVTKLGSKSNQKNLQMINVSAPGNTAHPNPIHIRLILCVEFGKVGHTINW